MSMRQLFKFTILTVLEWLKPTHVSYQFFEIFEACFLFKSFDDVLNFGDFAIFLVIPILGDFTEESFLESSNGATLISEYFRL